MLTRHNRKRAVTSNKQEQLGEFAFSMNGKSRTRAELRTHMLTRMNTAEHMKIPSVAAIRQRMDDEGAELPLWKMAILHVIAEQKHRSMTFQRARRQGTINLDDVP
eukprot:1647776-Prymnesium_polylepis.1